MMNLVVYEGTNMVLRLEIALHAIKEQRFW